MRILSKNIISEATISSLRSDLIYPAANIATEYIKHRYQATATDDVITLEWDTPQVATDIFWTFTNATALRFSFFDENWNEIYRVSGAGAWEEYFYYGFEEGKLYGFDDDSFYGYSILHPRVDRPYMTSWAKGASVEFKYLQVTISTDRADKVMLGQLALGEGVEIGWPVADWTEDYDDRSQVSKGESGQVRQGYIEPLRSYDWNFNGASREKTAELQKWYEGLGVGAKIWIAPFEQNLEFVEPLYAVLDAPIVVRKKENVYSYRLRITEAR